MCKMVKKGMLGAILGVGALALLFGTAAPRYVKTAYHKARSGADEMVPTQFKIDAARQEIADLEPAIHQNLEALVAAEVEVEQLQEEIAATESNLNREKLALVALRQSLDTGELKLTGSGVTYTPEEIKADLARRFDHYTQVKHILVEKRETLKIKEQNVRAARERLDAMQAAKQGLMVKIDEIEAKLNQIEAAQAANEFTIDDSALARAKRTVAELDKRLEVMARVAEQEGRYATGAVPVVVEPTRDVLGEIDAEFGAPEPSAEHATDKSL